MDATQWLLAWSEGGETAFPASTELSLAESSSSPPAGQPTSFCWLVKDGKRLPSVFGRAARVELILDVPDALN